MTVLFASIYRSAAELYYLGCAHEAGGSWVTVLSIPLSFTANTHSNNVQQKHATRRRTRPLACSMSRSSTSTAQPGAQLNSTQAQQVAP